MKGAIIFPVRLPVRETKILVARTAAVVRLDLVVLVFADEEREGSL
jgi:hypothetical protein